MDDILGIIAEYNPFHNGHLYHFNEAKKQSNCKKSIAIISGDFTQRGDISIVDKWSKTKMALNSGIDLVIELPVLYSVSSAENFASGAVKILNSLGITHLAFGCENANLEILNKISDILYEESDDFKRILSLNLDAGYSFPVSRSKALEHLLSLDNFDLSLPNNILAIEYLKAIRKINANIKKIPISRYKSNYNELETHSNIASATAIRNFIQTGNLNKAKNFMPLSSFNILKENFNEKHLITNISHFEKEIFYKLRIMSITEIAQIADVSEGLEFKIKKASMTCNSLNMLISSIKSKRYTLTRIKRILLYCLLNITKEDMDISKKVNPYVRVLGFNETGKEIISNASKQNPNLELIISVKKFMDKNTDNNLQILLEKDILATNIYTLGFENISTGNLDFTHKIEQI